jgi:translation initiation factor 1
MGNDNARTVFSTASGRVCPTCGWPSDDCKCSSRFTQAEPVPAKLTAKLRMEKSGRGGKTVTVVYALPRNAEFLKNLAQELKRVCGTGGTVTDDSVELQGDQRDRVRVYLQQKGYAVKG